MKICYKYERQHSYFLCAIARSLVRSFVHLFVCSFVPLIFINSAMNGFVLVVVVVVGFG